MNIQQLHKKCLGEIVITVDQRTKLMTLACKRCAERWIPLANLAIPKDFCNVPKDRRETIQPKINDKK